MNTQATIPGTEEAWETGQLGNDEKHIGHLSKEEISEDSALIQESMGLQPISIRLEKTLIDNFKAIATINGIGYQTLMRQALRRFAECEMKKILNERASEVKERIEHRKRQKAA